LLGGERGRLLAELENVPTAEQVREAGVWIAGEFAKYVDARQVALANRANSDFDGMTWEGRRALCQQIFSGRTHDHKRMSVYVEWVEGQARRKQSKY
jgi:hypothetical protein